MVRPFLVMGVFCVAAACAQAPAPKIAEVRDYQSAYTCADGPPMHVLFTPYNAQLESEGMSVAMTQQPAADGLFYAGGGQSLRARGPEATWTDAKGVTHQCREQVKPAG